MFKISAILLTAALISLAAGQRHNNARNSDVNDLIEQAYNTIVRYFNQSEYRKQNDQAHRNAYHQSVPNMFVGYMDVRTRQLIPCDEPKRMMKIEQNHINNRIRWMINQERNRLNNIAANIRENINKEIVLQTQGAYRDIPYNEAEIENQDNLWFAAWSDTCFVSKASYHKTNIYKDGQNRGDYRPHYEEYFAAYMNKYYNGMSRDKVMVAYSSKKPCDYGHIDVETLHSCTDVIKLVAKGRDGTNNWNRAGQDIRSKFLYVSVINPYVRRRPNDYGYLNWFNGNTGNFVEVQQGEQLVALFRNIRNPV